MNECALGLGPWRVGADGEVFASRHFDGECPDTDFMTRSASAEYNVQGWVWNGQAGREAFEATFGHRPPGFSEFMAGGIGVIR